MGDCWQFHSQTPNEPPISGTSLSFKKCVPDNYVCKIHWNSEILHGLKDFLSRNFLNLEVSSSSSFFQLGGHSISVGQLVNRIRRDLQMSVSIMDVYSSPSVRQLAAKLSERQRDEVSQRKAKRVLESQEELSLYRSPVVYPASYQQVSLEGMAQVSADASRALNLTFCCHIRGVLNVDCLHEAFKAVQLRHDALRSTFFREGSGLFCKVQSNDCLDFSQVDPPEDLAEWILDQQYEIFDLVNGPLCRVRLIQESSDAWILHWTLHHVTADLWSSFGWSLIRSWRNSEYREKYGETPLKPNGRKININ